MGVHMAEAGPPRKNKMRTVTVAALLGIFVGAAVLAVVARLMPDRVSGIVKKVTDRGSKP